jgi:hypothetical protein
VCVVVGLQEEKKKKKKKKADEIRFEDLKFEEKIGEVSATHRQLLSCVADSVVTVQGSFGEVFRGYLWGQEVALKKLRIKGDLSRRSPSFSMLFGCSRERSRGKAERVQERGKRLPARD